jgi:hypothetical protein
VSVTGQYWHSVLLVADGLRTDPPTVVMYCARYSPHVLPLGTINLTISSEEQRMDAFANEVPKNPSTMYVRGLTRYMKIQNRAIWLGEERILEGQLVHDVMGSDPVQSYPQNAYIMMNMRLMITPPSPSLSSPTITI